MGASRLRVVFCTNGGLHGALVLRRLLAAPRIEVSAVVISTRARGAGQGYWSAAFDYLRESGLAYTVYLWCSTTLCDFLLRFGSAGPVSRVALKRGIPLLATRDANDATGLRFVAGAAPDLLVSAFFNQRIGEALAGTPRIAALNIHPAELPALRGVDPVFFAKLEGHAAHGVSVHRVSPVLDGGALLATAKGPDDPRSVLATTAALYDRGAAILVRESEAIAANPAGTPQTAGGRYDSWPRRAQVAAFHRAGGRLARIGDLWRLARRGTSAFVIESEP